MLLLTIPTFDLRQTVIPVAEAPTMPCPDCEGQETLCGYGSGREPECEFGRVPFVGRIAIAASCQKCDDGEAPCSCPFGGEPHEDHRCHHCHGLGYLIVASAHVDAVVPIADPYTDCFDGLHICVDDGPDGFMVLHDPTSESEDLTNQLIYGNFITDHALILSDVQPTTERCPKSWGGSSYPPMTRQVCDACNAKGKCDPIPVAAGPAWREWPT